MANAGYSADKKFISQCIRDNKLLVIKPEEHPIIQDFKQRINVLLIEDEIKWYPSFNGKKYAVHTAWGRKYQLLIKINQIRMKNWFWDRLV